MYAFTMLNCKIFYIKERITFLIEDILLHKLSINPDFIETEYIILNLKFELKTALVLPFIGLNLLCEFRTWSVWNEKVSFIEHSLSIRKNLNPLDI
jgi:hypothetical protein